jgi:zinc transporter ZupT
VDRRRRPRHEFARARRDGHRAHAARRLERVLLPIVGLAAGSLLGGAVFHMLPESIDVLGNRLGVYVALMAGFLVFFALEQFLHWHHCHHTNHTTIDRSAT